MSKVLVSPEKSATPPYETYNADAPPGVLILCDHASNHIPSEIHDGDLGLPVEDMQRHIAFDVGAAGVTRALAREMNARAILSRFSRLVIDPNRGEDDPTLVMRLYDGTIVPANRNISEDEKRARKAAYYTPYRDAVTREIDRIWNADTTPCLISIHSYTKQLRGRPPRPWHVGVLWHHDGRMAIPLIAKLRAEPDLCIGDNQPYTGQIEGDTLSHHGTGRGLPHVLIELRSDLIETEDTQAAWAKRLAPILQEVVEIALHA